MYQDDHIAWLDLDSERIYIGTFRSVLVSLSLTGSISLLFIEEVFGVERAEVGIDSGVDAAEFGGLGSVGGQGAQAGEALFAHGQGCCFSLFAIAVTVLLRWIVVGGGKNRL
jgi:hypothetical protein